MPAIQPHYDPFDSTLSQLGNDERIRREKDIDKRWMWYAGAHPDVLKPDAGHANDNVKLNLCGRGIDRLLEFIGTPRGFIAPDNADPAAQSAIESAYADLVKPLLNELKLVALVAGHAYVKLWRDGDSIRAASIDPRAVTVYWSSGVGSIREPLWYRVQWVEGRTARRQDIVPRRLRDQDSPDGWDILEFKGKGASWELTGEEAWDEPFSPVVELRNRAVPWEYYGQTQLTDDVLQLNNAVNFLATNTARIIRYHAHPRTVAAGVDVAQIQKTSIDGMFTVPAGAHVFNLEMQSDLTSSMAMLQQMKGEFFATLRVTDVSSIKDRIGQITNFGVRMLHGDMLEQVEERRGEWGRTLADLTRRVAVMSGAEIERIPLATWPDALPQNRLEVLQSAQLEQALGVVSRETLAAELGRDYPAESARLAAYP